MSTETAIRSARLPSRNSLAMAEASLMRDVMVTAMPGSSSLKILVSAVACAWLTAKTIDLPRSPEGSRAASFRKGFAHHPIATRREDLSLQILNLEVFILFADHHGPALLSQRLCGDVGAQIIDLRQAKERALRVFHGIDDVVAEGGLARL